MVDHAAIGVGADFQDFQRAKQRAQPAAVALFTVHCNAIVLFDLWRCEDGFSI
jgi:hypothetical protein